VVGIVEEKDATHGTRLRESTRHLVAPTKKLKSWLAKLQNNNAQKEYLPHRYRRARNEGARTCDGNPMQTRCGRRSE